MQHVGREAAQVRLDAREGVPIGADHDAELPALRGKAGAGDRRVGIGNPAGGEPGRERAGEIHRRGGQVDQRGARLHHAKEPLADLGELRTARQRQEHHGGIPRRVLGG